jgi:hypothetical protein
MIGEALTARLENLDATLRIAVDRALPSAVADVLPEAVEFTLPRAIEETVPEAISVSVEPAVARGVERAIVGPPLTNFAGWLSVQIVDSHDQPVAIGDDGDVLLAAPGLYRVVVGIGPERAFDTTLPLRVTGGEDRDSATFDVVLDSDRRGVRQPPVELTVGTGETRFVATEFDSKAVADGAAVWLRVLQGGRLLQRADLTLRTA